MLPVPEQDQLAVVGWELLHRAIEATLDLAHAKHLVWSRLVAGQHPHRRVRVLILGVGVQRASPRLFLAQVIDGAVGGDTIQPGREPVLRIETGEREVDLQEHFLGQIDGQISLAGVAVEVVDQCPLVPPNQTLERAAVAGQGSFDQMFIGVAFGLGRSGPTQLQISFNQAYSSAATRAARKEGPPLRLIRGDSITVSIIQRNIKLERGKPDGRLTPAGTGNYDAGGRAKSLTRRTLGVRRASAAAREARLGVQEGRSASRGRHRRTAGQPQTPRLSGQNRRRLAALLNDKHLDGGRLLSRLREIRSFEGLTACAEVVHLLAHVELTEADAEELLVELMHHRGEMSGMLGRDPGLQVAAIDFLTHVRPLLTNPTIVELTLLDQTERYAITDPLTDLFNRRFFQSALDTEVRRSHRHSLKIAVLMLDLDSFKSVNDVYGHPFGDRVLRRAGRVIRRSVRESDTACRVGGEEFCVILPETDRLGAFAAGERVRRNVENDFADAPIDGRLVAMTISGGVACFPEDGDSSEGLVDRADEALYRSKLRGRNRVVIHHAEKRRTTRYPVNPSARARLVSRPTGDPGEVQPLNLSTGGALLESDRSYSRADSVVLTLEGGAGPCVLPARVVRVEAPDGTSVRRIAVEFERPMSASTLTDFVVRSRPSWASFGGDA